MSASTPRNRFPSGSSYFDSYTGNVAMMNDGPTLVVTRELVDGQKTGSWLYVRDTGDAETGKWQQILYGEGVTSVAVGPDNAVYYVTETGQLGAWTG